MPEPKSARINIEYPHMDRISDAMYGALISRLHTAQIPFDVVAPADSNSMDLFFYETDLDAAQKALEPCMLVEMSRDTYLRFLRPQMPQESPIMRCDECGAELETDGVQWYCPKDHGDGDLA